MLFDFVYRIRTATDDKLSVATLAACFSAKFCDVNLHSMIRQLFALDGIEWFDNKVHTLGQSKKKEKKDRTKHKDEDIIVEDIDSVLGNISCAARMLGIVNCVRSGHDGFAIVHIGTRRALLFAEERWRCERALLLLERLAHGNDVFVRWFDTIQRRRQTDKQELKVRDVLLTAVDAELLYMILTSKQWPDINKFNWEATLKAPAEWTYADWASLERDNVVSVKRASPRAQTFLMAFENDVQLLHMAIERRFDADEKKSTKLSGLLSKEKYL